jgi:nucleoid-associated protein YgaU
MAGLKRRILGITVISAGACAALPFRNEPLTAPVDTREAVQFPAAASSQNELTLQLTIPATPVPDATTVGNQHLVSVVAKTNPGPPPQEVRRDGLQAPPSIASAFEPLVTLFPVATEETTTTIRDAPERRHRIADGDTLEALAERYLGNRNQWRLIFEANDGVLTDRNILPIGKEIQIPQTRTPSRDDAEDHLVPIPRGLLSREQR